jgi:hypothetical protein
MPYLLQPKLQKHTSENQHWHKNGVILTYTVLYRTGFATLEEEPVVDLENPDPHGIDAFTLGTVDHWETHDSCSDSWGFSDLTMGIEEQDRIKTGFYDGGSEFLEADGWTLLDTELVFEGELELTEEGENETEVDPHHRPSDEELRSAFEGDTSGFSADDLISIYRQHTEGSWDTVTVEELMAELEGLAEESQKMVAEFERGNGEPPSTAEY